MEQSKAGMGLSLIFPYQFRLAEPQKRVNRRGLFFCKLTTAGAVSSLRSSSLSTTQLTGDSMKYSLSVAMMFGLFTARAAMAVSLPVANPGFEDISGESPAFEFTFGPINTDWQLYEQTPGLTSGGAGNDYFIGTLTPQLDPGNPGQFAFFPSGAAEGQRVGIAFNNAATGGGGEYGLQQTLSGSTLQPLARYRLRVAIGNIASGDSTNFGFFNLDGFPGYRVDLLAGDQLVASDNNTLVGAILDGQFAESEFSFTTGASLIVNGQELIGQPLGIRLVNLNVPDPSTPTTTTADLEVDFDDVRLDAFAAGDYNADGVVSGADYAAWRNTLASTTALAADGDNSGQIDAADLSVWTSGFGGTDVGLAAAGEIGASPEPSSVWLVLVATGSCGLRNRRRC